ncbi:MAG: ribosome small subunit-dependent GTPase A [Bacillota bacterium]
MFQGRVIKAAGGFFTVRDPEGSEYLCRARGSLKKDKKGLMVGDWVKFDLVEDGGGFPTGEGVVEEMLPRKNSLPRPPVANVDQLIVVMSLKQPECDWQLVNRLLVLAEKENLPAALCLNKTDLCNAREQGKLDSKVEQFPYTIFYTSAVSGDGLDTFKEKLKDRCSVLAGPSGVGKSTLLNAISPGLSLQTAPVSGKIKRGKHTTRQASLLPLETGGMVVDTPGFTRLNFFNIEPEELADLFPEFRALHDHCRFRDCLHLNEPGCAVREEIGRSLNPVRYEHYQYFMKELNKQEAY